MIMCIKSVGYYSSLFQDVLWVVELWLTQIHNTMLKREIADFDATALYPSAMHYMDGLLEGVPKTLSDKSYEFLIQQDGYLIILYNHKTEDALGLPINI